MFTHDKFLEGQSVDLKDVLIQTTPIVTPFSTFMLGKTVKATAPQVSWIEESINLLSAKKQSEGGNAPDYVADSAEMLNNYLEIVAATATVSNTAQASNAVGVSDLMAKEVANKTKAIKMYIEDMLINGAKGFDSASKTYSTGGILEQIHADNQLTDTALTPAKFNEMLEKMYSAGVNDNMTVFLPASLKQVVNTFDDVTFMARDKELGFDADLYTSVYGQVRFVLCEKLGANKLFVVNGDYLELPVLIPFNGKQEPVSGSKQSIYLETQLGLKLLNRKAAASFEIA
ncbi:SU10 major capsid protein [Bacillus sp. Hm123]|uniref:SU10 major capsid protein n=1 Tax=Bacillus sp. Hm123 TaxID=3450745 RepID=UPI003F4452E4